VYLEHGVYQYSVSAHAKEYSDTALLALELQAKDKPECARAAHYFGRELFIRGEYDKAITELGRHLSLPDATWAAERSASCRFISRCYQAKGDYLSAWHWANKAVCEEPALREPWVEAMRCCAGLGNVYGAVFYGLAALGVKERTGRYIEEPLSWGSYPYECLSWAYEKLGDVKNAVECRKQAAAITAGGDGNVKDLLRLLGVN
jgi:tetratricopeptide (TPR) repeat protein